MSDNGPYKRPPIIGGNSPGGELRCKRDVIATTVSPSLTPPTMRAAGARPVWAPDL